MKKIIVLLCAFLMASSSLFAQKEKRAVVVKITTHETTHDTVINIEEMRLDEMEVYIADSLLEKNGQIVFIDKEGKRTNIHPDSLNAISVEVIDKIEIIDEQEGKLVIIEEKRDAAGQGNKWHVHKKSEVKGGSIEGKLYSNNNPMTEEEIKKLKDSLANIFDEIELKEGSNENGKQVIYFKIQMKNKKEK